MTAYSVYRQDDEPEPPSAARRPALSAPTYRRSGGAAAALAARATVSDREASDDSAVPVVLQLPDLSVLDDESPGIWHWVAGRLFWVGITLGALFALWLIWSPKKAPPTTLDEAPSWSGNAAEVTSGNQTNDSPAMSVAPAFPASAPSIMPASTSPPEENLAPPAPADSEPPAAADEPTFAPAPGDDISRAGPPREPLHVARREPPPAGEVQAQSGEARAQPGEAVPTGRITNTLVPAHSAAPSGSAAPMTGYAPGSTASISNTAPPINSVPANTVPPVNTMPPANTVSP